MTIDELLAEAMKYASLAVNGNGDRALFAQIAQSCAQTAQAMILAQREQRMTQPSEYWPPEIDMMAIADELQGPPCDLCMIQGAMVKIQTILDNMPEIGSQLYDDAITDVANAAQRAHELLEHDH